MLFLKSSYFIHSNLSPPRTHFPVVLYNFPPRFDKMVFGEDGADGGLVHCRPENNAEGTELVKGREFYIV
jgi:hypothetical protein